MKMENTGPSRRVHWESAEDDWAHVFTEYASTCLIVMLMLLYFVILLDAAGA